MALTIQEHALRYTSYGWLVIPVTGKRPTCGAWQTKATCSPFEAARLFSTNPHDGCGVQLGQYSNLIDFDCDSEEAESTLMNLFEGTIPNTPSFRSTRGRHVLFRWTDKLKSPHGAIKIVVDGLEIRLGNGDKGCQTVFPPSSGREWIIDPDSAEVQEIPEAVLNRINSRYAEIHKPKEIAKQVGFSTDYECQNERLNVPKWLSKHGREIIGRTEGSDGTTRWHIQCPGIDQHTTSNSFRDCCVTQDHSGKLGGGCFHSSCGMQNWQDLKTQIGDLEWSDYHEEETGQYVDLSQITSVPAKPKQPEPVNPDRMSDAFYRIPGMIGDMIAYHVYNAPRPRPELSLAASIALMGAITGRKIQTKSGMRTNIYCVGLAPSGSGKEQPRQNNTMALIEAGIENILGSENPASDAALVGELAENPAKLIQIDEVSRYFSTLKNAGNNSTHLKNIFTRFLELTGQAQNPAWTPKGYADGKKSKTICHPHLCIYGTSTSEGFWSSVASSDAVDGFLARMMVIEADNKYPRLQDVETSPIPQSVIDILKDWNSFSPPAFGNMSDQFPRAMTVHVESAAADRIKSHSDGIEDRLNDGPDDQKAIWSRSSALAKRLSLIFAASRGPFEILVTLEDAQLAVKLSNWCTRLLVRRVFTHVSANEADSDKKKVLEIIRRHREITANELTRKTQWIRNKRSRSEILDELVDGGFIMRISRKAVETGGRPADIFAIV